jgi:hypothetical protein
MEKIDLKKKLKDFYQASAKDVVFVDVPPMNYLMIDGEGDPNVSQAYAEAVEALFTVSYTLKFKVKKGALAIDYGVMPLEGLWWADDMSSFLAYDKSRWKWTSMIMQPDFVTGDMVGEAMAEAAKKKSLAALSRLRFEALSEGPSAQVLHLGPFSEEGPTIERLHESIGKKGRRRDRHHEIYLSDIRKSDPAKWRTIIRQPMEYGKAG